MKVFIEEKNTTKVKVLGIFFSYNNCHHNWQDYYKYIDDQTMFTLINSNKQTYRFQVSDFCSDQQFRL